MNIVEKALGFPVTWLLDPRTSTEGLREETQSRLGVSRIFAMLMVYSVPLVWMVQLQELLPLHDIYAYVFDFGQVVLEVPDFLAISSVLQGLDTQIAVQAIADLSAFGELPAAEILFQARALVGFSTLLLTLRTVVQSAFFAVHFLTGGRLGIEGVALVSQDEESDVEQPQASHAARAQPDDQFHGTLTHATVIGNTQLWMTARSRDSETVKSDSDSSESSQASTASHAQQRDDRQAKDQAHGKESHDARAAQGDDSQAERQVRGNAIGKSPLVRVSL